jgi:hypothetical protein
MEYSNIYSTVWWNDPGTNQDEAGPKEIPPWQL